MLIAVFVKLRPEPHQEPCNEVGPLSLAKRVVGFDLGFGKGSTSLTPTPIKKKRNITKSFHETSFIQMLSSVSNWEFNVKFKAISASLGLVATVCWNVFRLKITSLPKNHSPENKVSIFKVFMYSGFLHKLCEILFGSYYKYDHKLPAHGISHEHKLLGSSYISWLILYLFIFVRCYLKLWEIKSINENIFHLSSFKTDKNYESFYIYCIWLLKCFLL